MTSDDKKAIADLKVEVDKLKAALAPTPNDAAAVGAWRDEQHAMAERRASAASPFSLADLAAFEAAAPTSVVKDIAMRDSRGPLTPCSPGAIPPSVTASRPVGTGWREASPLSNPPGINYADRLMDAQDAKDRHERIVEEAQRQALIKAAEKAASDG